MQSLFRSEAIEQLSAVREGSPIKASVASWRLVLTLVGGGLATALVVLALLKLTSASPPPAWSSHAAAW